MTARVFNEPIQGADDSMVEQVRVDTAGEAEDAAAGEGTAIFTNSYAAASTTATISVQKTLEGRAWLETDDFGFVLTPAEAGQPMPAEAQADGEGNVSATLSFDADADGYTGTAAGTELTEAFGTIAYTQADLGTTDAGNPARSKTFTYYVDETNSDGEGITADAHVATVTVAVTDNGNGTMSATVSYENSDSTDPEDKANTSAAAFTNTYNVGETSLDGEANLKVTKTIANRPWLATDTFSFVLAGASDATNAAIESGDVILPGGGTTATIDITGVEGSTDSFSKAFGNITFKKASPEGGYSFTITEVKGNISGMTYDTTPRTITVEVTEDLATGQLTPTVVEGSQVSPTFTNTYSAETAEGTGAQDHGHQGSRRPRPEGRGVPLLHRDPVGLHGRQRVQRCGRQHQLWRDDL